MCAQLLDALETELSVGNMYRHVYMSIHISVHMSIHMSVRMSVHMCAHLLAAFAAELSIKHQQTITAHAELCHTHVNRHAYKPR